MLFHYARARVNSLRTILAAWCMAAPCRGQAPALFDYDHSVPYQYQEERISGDSQIEILGAGFQSPKGGRVRMFVVRPVGKGPYAGIIYQHGGGTSLFTYIGEAEVLARAPAR